MHALYSFGKSSQVRIVIHYLYFRITPLQILHEAIDSQGLYGTHRIVLFVCLIVVEDMGHSCFIHTDNKNK